MICRMAKGYAIGTAQKVAFAWGKAFIYPYLGKQGEADTYEISTGPFGISISNGDAVVIGEFDSSNKATATLANAKDKLGVKCDFVPKTLLQKIGNKLFQ